MVFWFTSERMSSKLVLNRPTAPQLNQEPNLTEPAKVTHRLTHWYYVKKWREEVEDNFHEHNF